MIRFNKSILALALFIFIYPLIGHAQEENDQFDWQLGTSGETYWQISESSTLPHADHMAMSGQSVDMILEWGLDSSGSFHAKRLIRWPMLRTIPNDCHASLQRRLGDTLSASPLINGKALSSGIAIKLSIKGSLSVESDHNEGIRSERTIFPSVLNPTIIDMIRLTNTGDRDVDITIPSWKRSEPT